MTEIPADRIVRFKWQYRKCNKCKRCKGKGYPGHGPYIYAEWTENGKPKSKYCGKRHPELLEELMEGIRQG